MTRPILVLMVIVLLTGCGRKAAETTALQPKAFGSALVEVSGGKQVAPVGTPVDQPLVVQVNDEKGTAVPGALVSFQVNGDAVVTPPEGLTGSDGQFSAIVALGTESGHYQVVAATRDKSGKAIELKSDQIALGYQQILGRQLNDRYCSRCHDSESTAERVSNHDNLKAPPHAFSDGAFLNKMSDADLAAIIGHGGPAVSKSPEMPPYAGTLQKAEIDAIIAYIRAIADPPYHVKGLVYAKD